MAPLVNTVTLKGLTLVLVTVLVTNLGVNPAPAWAAQPLILPTPPDLLNVANLNDPTSLSYSTGAQRASLDNLQQEAIRNTLAHHGLPPGDAVAVQSWARDEAEGELYVLLVQAANTLACPAGGAPGDACRSVDQQNAVNWLADMTRREGVLAARNAGLEYVKWAGLDQTTYLQLVNRYVQDLSAGSNNTSTDKANLENLLTKGFSAPLAYASPQPGTTWSSSTTLQTIQQTATAGFCVYRSPVPYQSEYKGNIFAGTALLMPQICQRAGGNYAALIDPNPPTPAYEDFVKWGQADTIYGLINNVNYTWTANSILVGIALGSVVASATVGIIAGALPGTLALSGFAKFLFPFAGRAGGQIAADAAAANSGAIAAGAVGAIAAGIIVFVAGTTIESLQLANGSQLPVKLATLIEDAPNHAYDPSLMIQDTNGTAMLFALFVNATQPRPLTNCVIYSPVSNPVCLVPPEPPAPDLQNDPEFFVSTNLGAPIPQATITWYDKATQLTATARVHGTWFIEQLTDRTGSVSQVTYITARTGQEVQSLRVMYTDWNDNEQFVLLFNVPNVGYRFVSMSLQQGATVLDPSTCQNSAMCASSDTIQYVDSAGNKYSAKLSQPASPVVTAATWTPQNPVEGQPVTLQPNVSSTIPGGSAAYTATWTIEDKPLTRLIQAACLTALGHQVPCVPPSVTLTGNPATYSFPTSGSFSVTLSLSDSAGRSASSSVFTVQVADSPPQLAVFPACNPNPLLICTLRSPNVLEVPLGTATSLGGELIHAGREDVESLVVNWGDNSPDNTASNKASSDPNLMFDVSNQSDSSGNIHLPFRATHTYADPGPYTVTLTATDQSGATTTTTVSEQVLTIASTTSTATPSPTASLTPAPDSTSTPTATATSTPSPTAPAASTPSQTVEATATLTPAPAASATATSTSGQPGGSPASPDLTSTATLAATPTPTNTPAATATSTSAPAPTSTRTSATSSGGDGGTNVGGTAAAGTSGGSAGAGAGAGAGTGAGGGAGAGATGGAAPQPAQAQPGTNAGVPAGAPPVEVGGVTVTGTQPATPTQPDIAGAPGASPGESPAAYAALSIGLIGVEGLAPGQQALFTVLVVNTGPVDALPTLVVQDVLPAGLTFARVVTDDWGCASDDGLVVSCTSTSTLSGGAATQLQLAVDVAGDATGTLTNVASVSSASLDPTSPSPTSVDTLEVVDGTESPISTD